MRTSLQESGPVAKVLAAVGGVMLLVLGLMFSLVVLAVAVVAGLGLWGWFWWKTRRLRREIEARMREQAAAPQAGGDVFEGEAVIVEEEVTRATVSRLPASPDRHSPD